LLPGWSLIEENASSSIVWGGDGRGKWLDAWEEG
jgi:hypothetical protein